MEDKEYSNVYAIPANYTDSGKLFGGMVETRNAIETVFLVVLVGYPELMWIPMPATIRIVVLTVTLLPLAVVSLMGIDGDSLLQYTVIFQVCDARYGNHRWCEVYVLHGVRLRKVIYSLDDMGREITVDVKPSPKPAPRTPAKRTK